MFIVFKKMVFPAEGTGMYPAALTIIAIAQHICYLIEDIWYMVLKTQSIMLKKKKKYFET